MFTHKRLDDCYRRSKKLKVDDTTKLIFFSDVHRGDNSMADEFAHNQIIYRHALEHYYMNDYTYVELGDGDELLEHAHFKYIRSAHSDVYMLLRQYFKENRLIYLYGNHNIKLKYPHYVQKNFHYFEDEYTDQTMDLFPNIEIYESLLLEYQKTGQQILAVHGHQGDLFNDQLWFTGVLGMRLFWRYMHMVGFRNPSSPAKNRTKRHKIEKNFSTWILENQTGIICGHTHRPKLPSSNELPYFNTGCCIHPRGINGIELVNGTLALVYWEIKPDKDGQLSVYKKVSKGPFRFESFEFLRRQ